MQSAHNNVYTVVFPCCFIGEFMTETLLNDYDIFKRGPSIKPMK